MNPVNAKAFNTTRLKLKKNNRNYEEKIKEYRNVEIILFLIY